jgi:hypothetical protein
VTLNASEDRIENDVWAWRRGAGRQYLPRARARDKSDWNYGPAECDLRCDQDPRAGPTERAKRVHAYVGTDVVEHQERLVVFEQIK